MPQVFSRRSALVVKLVLVGLGGAFVALVVAGGIWREHWVQALGEPLEQPIPFSHKHHVGDDGIDCRYCHTTVETSRHAGLPSTHICLTC
ncbi:MAG TPA: cytochrome c3 family protein, partial [Caldimonas sp.]|nr:cytochrome c3 family protein [Caldimonas sp.]